MRGIARVCLCLAVAFAAGLGCVRREIEILSRPPGATVTFDGRVLEQATPVRLPFTWYGTHEMILEKRGYHRERLVAHMAPPWYEQFPIDFLTENVWPGRFEDIRTYPIVMVKERPLKELSDKEQAAIKQGLLTRAEQFRQEARAKVGAPPPEEPEPKPATP